MSAGVTIELLLKPASTWRGRTPDGRDVVLKKLPDDCVRGGRLHPAIALRLTRLREAPVAGLVNLIGVERTEVGVVTVSEFVPGESLDALPLAGRAMHLPAARQLVNALHRAGLVHGAIGPGNFIVGPGGGLRLIDPSPLLYDDPAIDLADLARMGPDDAVAEEPMPRPRADRATLAAAAALSLAAVAGAAGWVWHVAGRS